MNSPYIRFDKDTLPSSEFRRRYSKLTRPTIVTVNGHAIGLWTPGPDGLHVSVVDSIVRDGFAEREAVRQEAARTVRTFTPVPKPSQRK